MGRTAVFVDAGYLFARGSEAIAAHTQQRHRLLLDEAKAVAALIAFAEARSRTPGSLLRIYWYDAAAAQGPNADHLRLAETDDVKLRLGVLNTFGQQKGVDSLIIADLIELARNQAIDTAVLMSGDDDLRVGVQVAQTFGVRVHLLGISGPGGEAQSKLLVREADTWTRWGKDEVAAFLSLREIVPPDAPAAPAAPPAEEIGSTNGEPPAEAVDVEATLRATAERFLAGLQPADLLDIETVYDATRKVPYQHDKRLLATARTDLGRDLDTAESRTLRTFFLQALRRLRVPPPPPGAPG